ncbi:MAG: hypothetical protein WC748_03305 [Legionellales bacterium]|jgi:Ran GTPase-activating protein (RanGAP) involved in mRNA processing and transport
MNIKDLIKELENNNPTRIEVDLIKEFPENVADIPMILKALSKNTILKKLRLSIYGPAETVIEALECLISEHKTLEHLHLQGDIKDTVLARFINALGKKTAVKELTIQNTFFDDTNIIGVHTVKAISDIFVKNKNDLPSLSLNNMNFNTEQGRQALTLIGQAKLESLNLGGNNLDNASIEVLIESLEKNTSLKRLFLAANNFTTQGLSLITGFLESNKNIEVLDLGNNNMSTKDDVNALVRMVENNTILNELMLDATNLGPQGVKEIGIALQKNEYSSITVLNFDYAFASPSNNPTDVEQAIATLIQNKRITKLNISTGVDNTNVASEIGNALTEKPNLESLAISNYITPRALKPIFTALEKNTSLKEFTLQYSYIDAIDMGLLSKALGKNTTLTSLCLSHINNFKEVQYDNKTQDDSDINLNDSNDLERDKTRGIHASKMAELFEAFTANNTIVTLDLNSNNINDNSVAQIGLLLKKNSGLETLNLTNNPIGVEGLKYIADGLEKNYILTQLMLDKAYENSDEYRLIQTRLLRNRKHYSETLKSRIDGIKKIDKKLDKINSKEDIPVRIYGLKELYALIPGEISHDSNHRIKLIEKMYTSITQALRDRIDSNYFKNDTIGQLHDYVIALNLVKKDDATCEELSTLLSERIESMNANSDNDSDSETENKESQKRSDTDFFNSNSSTKRFKRN